MAKVERQIKRVAMGDGLFRNTATISGFPCAKGTPDQHIQLTRLLQQLTEEPHLLTQNIGFPNRILIRYDGTGWTAIVDSEEDLPVV